MPDLKTRSFDEQIGEILNDGFSALHMWAPGMKEIGYDSHLVIPNCMPAQLAWLRAHPSKVDPKNASYEIVRRQIEHYDPDVLFIGDPINFDGSFLRTLAKKPPLVMTWRAALVPHNTDWRGFDVILSSLTALREELMRRGARHGEHFLPGFPEWIAPRVEHIQPEYDVVFAGQYNESIHGRRSGFIRAAAQESLKQRSGFSCVLYLSAPPDLVPAELSRLDRGPRYGMAMHEALRTGRIAIDGQARIGTVDAQGQFIDDLTGDETANMRIFEAAGCGIFVLTEHKRNLASIFEVGKEIETFTDTQELLDKIRYYVAHPEKREAIARAGQARCLRDHTMRKRAQQLDGIIRKYIPASDSPSGSRPPDIITRTSNGAAQTAKAMKVVHVSWMDSAGAGAAAYRLHSGLRKLGVDSTMLVLHKTHSDPWVRIPPMEYDGTVMSSAQDSTAGIQAIMKNDRRWALLVSQYPNRSKNAEIFTDPFSDVRLQFVREVAEADIVNLHWVAGLLDYPSMHRGLAEKPVVWTMHDMNPFTGGCHYSDGCERYIQNCGQCPNLAAGTDDDASRYFHRIKALAYAATDLHPVSPSRWLSQCARQSSLMQEFSHRVIPNGVSTDVFQPRGREQLREKHLIGGKKLILFGAASITIERKGFRYLGEALARLAAGPERDNIVLGVFGTISDTTHIEQLPLPVIAFGHIADQKALAQIYSAADVYVLPTLADNLPNTIVEAMACGCPTVAFETGGVPDLIEHGRNGFLVRQRDVDGLVEGIRWAPCGGTARKEISAYCRKIALERYDETVQAKAYLALYTECLHPRREALDMSARAERAAAGGDIEAAKRMYDTAIRACPRLSLPRRSIGMIYRAEKNNAQALDAFAAAIKVNPSDRASLAAMGEMLFEQNTSFEIFMRAAEMLDANPLDTGVLEIYLRAQAAHLDTMLAQARIDTERYTTAPYGISAIVAAALDERYVVEIVDDIIGQEKSPAIEIIVVRAAGGPQSLDFLHERMRLAGNIRCVVPSEHLTLYQAIALGARAASGRYCIAAVTGDRLAPDCCARLSAALDAAPAAAAAFGDCLLAETPHVSIAAAHASAECGKTLGLRDTSYNDLIENYGLGPHVMWRKAVHETCGYFDFRYDAGADQDLWLRCARTSAFVRVDTVSGTVWLNELSKNRFTRTLKQFPHVRRKYKLFPLNPPALEDASAGSVPKDLVEAKSVLDTIVSLVESGKHREALGVYDQNARLFEAYPERERIKSLMEKLRRK